MRSAIRTRIDRCSPSMHITNTASIKPEYLVAVGICTHLGCFRRRASSKRVRRAAPALTGREASCALPRFDLRPAGRASKNRPAPDNLEVPPHMYLSDAKIIIGEDGKA